MRVCAVGLPELRVELVRESDPSLERAPLAIVVAPPPMTETKLLGNTRLDVVSYEAERLGVRSGQTIAQARARAGALAVRVVRPEAVAGVLARLAEIALAFGATVAFSTDEDVVWVDITGCAHLHSSSQLDGERILATRLRAVFESLGHRCSVAVADGPRIASMLARMARPDADPDAADVIVVPTGANARAIERLPARALPLPEADVRWLAKIGVRTIAELRALPRAGLASRLGANAAVVLALMDGDDRAPLTPYVPPEVPEEEVTLEYGIEGVNSVGALTFVAKTLTDRLSARLAGRAVAASKIELELRLDAALLEDRKADKEIVTCLLPAPLSTASDLLAAMRPRLERLVLRAPVLSAKLRAPTLVHKPQAVLSLFEAQPKADRALPRLVAELAADLGPDAVGTLVLGDSWVPEDRSRFMPLEQAKGHAARTAKKKRRHLVSSVPEPTRILAEPEPVPRETVKVVRHLSRTEAVEWWKQMPEDKRLRGVDHVYAWVADAAAWVEIDRRSGSTRVRGWFD